jgi:hypothetical protein
VFAYLQISGAMLLIIGLWRRRVLRNSLHQSGAFLLDRAAILLGVALFPNPPAGAKV